MVPQGSRTLQNRSPQAGDVSQMLACDGISKQAAPFRSEDAHGLAADGCF
jgi:hypothetical protein